MSQGYIPLWNPYQFCGTPFLANGQSAVLYPLNLVFLVFDPITAFTAYAWLHLFLAATFTYVFMRRIGCEMLGGTVAGVVYTFSAFMVLWLELPTFVGAAVWLPLVLLLIEMAVKQCSVLYGMIGGAVLAMAFLAGHFQIAFYVALAAGLWWLCKVGQVWRAEGKTYVILKVAVPLLGFVLIAVLTSAAQVLPAQELAMNSHRIREANPQGYAAFIANALKPYRLITMFVPNFFGNPANGDYYLLGMVDGHAASAADYMEYGVYAGILPLLLTFLALSQVRRAPFIGYFALMGGLSLLIALGTPLNLLFYYGVPGFCAIGGPNRILMLYLFAIAGMAGFGADILAENLPADGRAAQQRRMLVGAISAIGVTVVLSVLTYAASQDALSYAVRWWASSGFELRSSEKVITFAGIFLVSAALMLAGASKIVTRSLGFCLVTVTVLDLFAVGINYNPTCERFQVYPATALTSELRKLTENGERIAPINANWSLWHMPKAIIPPNAAMVYGLYDVQGYDSLYTKFYKDLSSESQGVDSSPPENGNMVLVRRFTGGVGSRAAYVLEPTVSASKFPRADVIFRGDGVSVYRLRVSLPPAVHAQTNGRGNILRMAGAKMKYRGPNVIRVVGTLRRGNLVVVNATGYPGWQSRRGNGRPSPVSGLDCLKARASCAETITFSFEPFSFRLGLFMMCVGMGLLSAFGSYRILRIRGGLTDG
jgi:hypothetical protein